MRNELKVYTQKLHVVIPSELFDAIYKHRDMDNIDNIVTNLLYEYYGVELNVYTERR